VLITLTVAMRNRVVALLWLGLIPAQLAPAALARPPGQPQNTKLLERSWQKLDAQLRALGSS
jgi:outer membrane factor, OMF family